MSKELAKVKPLAPKDVGRISRDTRLMFKYAASAADAVARRDLRLATRKTGLRIRFVDVRIGRLVKKLETDIVCPEQRARGSITAGIHPFSRADGNGGHLRLGSARALRFRAIQRGLAERDRHAAQRAVAEKGPVAKRRPP